jgi:hypothetical protein
MIYQGFVFKLAGEMSRLLPRFRVRFTGARVPWI